jgi:hypothetical protein
MNWLTHCFVISTMAITVACQPEPAAVSQQKPADTAAASQPKGKATPVLAKANLAAAIAAGKKWKADAILFQVGAHGVGDDGLHVMWDYGVYSPGSKTCVLDQYCQRRVGRPGSWLWPSMRNERDQGLHG